MKKLKRNLSEPVKFVVIYQTKKISYFLPKKDKIPTLSLSNLIYEFTCSGCYILYIGETEQNLSTRTAEHLDPQKSTVFKHLIDCDDANCLLNVNNLFGNKHDSGSSYSCAELMPNNTKILQSLNHTNSNLLFLEAMHIKFIYRKPNSGLKASKELIVFS